jgi:ribosomal protein S18 acetylase RimI-like enzyme
MNYSRFVVPALSRSVFHTSTAQQVGTHLIITNMSTYSSIQLRSMTTTDLPAVCDIQQHCYYASYWERIDVFAEKIALFPIGCFVAFVNDLCRGYVFSHPWFKDNSVPLDSPIDSLPLASDCYYLHDCAVDPQARSRGIGEKLIKEVIRTAQNIGARNLQLVSVQQSQNYWGRFGFVTLENSTPESDNHLISYGPDAQMMSLNL